MPEILHIYIYILQFYTGEWEHNSGNNEARI